MSKFALGQKVKTIPEYTKWYFKSYVGIVKKIEYKQDQRYGPVYIVIDICTKDGIISLGEDWLELDCSQIITTGGLKIGDYVKERDYNKCNRVYGHIIDIRYGYDTGLCFVDVENCKGCIYTFYECDIVKALLVYPWYIPIYKAERCNKVKEEKVKECERNNKIFELVEENKILKNELKIEKEYSNSIINTNNLVRRLFSEDLSTLEDKVAVLEDKLKDMKYILPIAITLGAILGNVIYNNFLV